MPRRRASSSNASTSPPKRQRYSLRNTRARINRRQRLAKILEGRANTLTDEEFRDKSSLLKEKKIPGKALSVQNVSTLRRANRKHHNTHCYEQKDTILRRGLDFDIVVTFDRNVDKNHDCVTLQFTFGSRPKVSKGTAVRIPLSLKSSETTKDVSESWQASTTIETPPNTLKCTITSPPDAWIGNYEMYVETKLKEDIESSRHKVENRIIMLFNPFCKNDSTYMEDENARDEYVMNDRGNIWVGSAYWNRGREWNFGQFEEPVLEAALYLLDLAELGNEARNSPVLVSRAISGAVNSFDNDGLLEGNWSGDYSDGTSPSKWTGSVEIIEQFMNTGTTVMFGQCWVFSGVTTSLLRAIGIPTRSVTNFDSAHDTDCSMTIDRHYDEMTGESLEDLDDSVWNFHVWNESWFKRSDLPDGYDGWQALDGTPQETSGGVYKCGPASLKAIKEGHVYLQYDTPFIYSEVNGDRISWQVNQETDTYKVMKVKTSAVGHNISTKKVGSSSVDILNNQYKYPEGSKEERKVAQFVNRFSTEGKKCIYKSAPKQEIKLKLELPNDKMASEDLVIYVRVINITKEKRKITGRISLFSCVYTGQTQKRIKDMEFEETLKGGEEKRVKMPVTYKEYGDKMNREAHFSVTVTGKNDATGRMAAKDKQFELKKPEIFITIPNDECEYGEDTKVKVMIKNTTKIELTQCQFNIESTGALKAVTIMRDGDKSRNKPRPLRPGEEWTVTVSLRPQRRYRSDRTVVAEFDCKELDGMDKGQEYRVVNYRTDSDDED